jgi:hypothetical protein
MNTHDHYQHSVFYMCKGLKDFVDPDPMHGVADSSPEE